MASSRNQRFQCWKAAAGGIKTKSMTPDVGRARVEIDEDYC